MEHDSSKNNPVCCKHACSGNCRREGCDCACGEFHCDPLNKCRYEGEGDCPNHPNPTAPDAWEKLIALFGANEIEARFLSKILSNDDVGETLVDIRILLAQARADTVAEVLAVVEENYWKTSKKEDYNLAVTHIKKNIISRLVDREV